MIVHDQVRRPSTSPRSTVAVLAPSRIGLGRILSRALGPHAKVVEINSLPSAKLVEDWILVIDPVDVLESREIARVGGLAELALVYILLGDGLTRSDWLAVASNPKVRLLPCGTRTSGTAPIVAAISQALVGPQANVLTDLVLKREPSLGAMQSAVHFVIAQPWDIRHPKDLSRISGIPLGELGRQARTLGLLRVEHFILLVRMVAFEAIIGSKYRVPLGIARVAVGFSDPSNMRRQVARALKNTEYEHLARLIRRAV